MRPEIAAAISKRKARAQRRQDNARFQAQMAGSLVPRKSKPQKTGHIKQLSSVGAIKSQIVRLLGLSDRRKHGPQCRIIPECPVKGYHFGTLAYHIVPAQRGDATRFEPENVVWACRSANYGEVMNRSLYREKHIKVFGRDRVERLEAKAREYRKFSRAELLELREAIKREVETTTGGSRSNAI